MDSTVEISHNRVENLPGSVVGRINVPPTTEANLNDVEDLTKVCRLCATITDLVLPIFTGTGLHNKLADKINQHLPIQVSESDDLPVVVCYQCVSTVLAWHELVKCSLQADQALKAKVARDKQKNSTRTAEGRIQRDDTHFLDYSDDSSEQSDDKPLATFTKSNNSYMKFYEALVNFRNHFVNEHKTEESYPDFTDSSASEVDDSHIDCYDDLTQFNMRKDKMDDETRLELSQVQVKINGKVFYTCRICGKNLSSSHTYVFHKRIHTGERPCVCHICGKQFRAPSGLQRHLTETHERARRYTCSLCPKNFANTQNLKQHLRIHTGERPFVCSHCGKRFTQSGSLHVHLKTHSDQFPYQCAECSGVHSI